MLRRCTAVLANPWAVHVSKRKNVVEMIDQLVAKGVLQKDPRQRDMAEMCTPLLKAVQEAAAGRATGVAAQEPIGDWRTQTLKRARQFFSVLASKYKAQLLDKKTTAIDVQWPENVGVAPSISSGLYIWGDVGIGKTMVLDLFEMCPTPQFAKRRVHLHSFMTMLSDRLHSVERAQRAAKHASSPSMMRRPIDVVVDEIVGETPILCFDEFQTFDVAHAALLAEFFSLAFQRGIFLMTTSNRPPHELFHLSSTFGSFLHVLYQHCNVVHCGGIQDYRCAAALRGAYHNLMFLSPASDENEKTLLSRVQRALPDGSSWSYGIEMPLYGRVAIVPRVCGGVAVFDFPHICGKGQMLGPQDFQLFAKSFHTVVILNVPQIGVVSKNAAKQFIVLVDELYQYKVKLLFTSSVQWERLFDLVDVVSGKAAEPLAEDAYTQGADERTFGDYLDTACSEEELLSFARVKSRLYEMGSQQYLHSHHVDFHVDDFDVSALLSL